MGTAQHDIDLKVACRVRVINSTDTHSPSLLVLLAIDKTLDTCGECERQEPVFLVVGSSQVAL